MYHHNPIDSQKQALILVDAHDNSMGSADKLSVHRLGLLHRAFSVFIFKQEGASLSVLLQKRHSNKYHSGGLWANTCCSHPRVGEPLVTAANRRLKEEMNVVLPLTHVGYFHYFAQINAQYSEHELDHVFVGYGQDVGIPDFCTQEVACTRWMPVDDLLNALRGGAPGYAIWLEPALVCALNCTVN